MRSITLNPPQTLNRWMRVYKLYLTAFPRTERKPFGIIYKMYRKGKMDVWCLEEKGQFLGIAITINSEKRILIDYLAVSQKHRGSGVGTSALHALREKYAGKGVFLEIESIFDPCKNKEQRLKRRQFYLRCGMTPMHVMVNLFGVKMELLGFDCRIDYETYYAFYRDNLGTWVTKHIAPGIYPEE